MAARGKTRSRWTLLLGASLAAVAIVSLLTFATLARRTSLRDAPGPRVAAIEGDAAPTQINLPSPSPTGSQPDTEGAPLTALPPAGAPDVDATAAPTATSSREAGADRSPRAKQGTDGGGEKAKPRPSDDEGGPGPTFASGGSNDKPGKGPKEKPADHPSKSHGPAHDKPAKAKANGHGNSHGKGHSKGHGKGHAKHGD